MHITDKLNIKSSILRFFCTSMLCLGTCLVFGQVSLTTNKTNLKTIIKRIKSKTKYQFFYSDALGKEMVNAVSIRNLPIDFVLDRVFENTNISYKIIDHVVYLKKVIVPPKHIEKQIKNVKPSTINPSTPVKSIDYEFYGQVQDVNGLPLIGATIQEKGSYRTSAIADLDGKFILKTKDAHPTIVISCVGFQSLEKRIDTADNQIFVLNENLYELTDVMVTALGINRSKHALNYDVTELSNDDINRVKSTNISNTLNGKVAGVVVNESSAGMGGAARVVMRGPKSLAQSNQPLYVIDGIPVNNRSNDDIRAGIYSMQPGSEGIADINPDDVESISVLTGPAAAALYGSAAAQGVVMIRTKSGKIGKMSIELSSSIQSSSPFVLPQFQDIYGNRKNEMKSWGEKREVWRKGFSPTDFFRTGITFNNSIALTTGSQQNQLYLALGSTTSSGLVPNNDFHRYNLTLKNVYSALEDKLKMTFSFKFIRENDKNMLAQGQYFNPLLPVYLFPRGESFDEIKQYEQWDDSRNIFIQNWNFGDDLKMQNPYWVSNRMVKTTKRNRYLTDFSIKYDFTPWLALEGRLRWDEANNLLEDKRYASTIDVFAHSPYGYYSSSKVNDRAFYGDILFDIKHRWNKLYFSMNGGASFAYSTYDITGFQGGLKSPSNMFTPNGIDYGTVTGDNRPVFDNVRHGMNSLLTSVEMGWGNHLFMTLTGRNDWDSSLSNTAQHSFFYPSIGFSAIISEMVKLPSFINYLKLRGSWASVGSAIPTNISSQSRYEYVPSTGTYRTITYKFPDTFYPERTNSWEMGFVARLFQEHLMLKFTYYRSNTKNQTFLRQITLGGAYDREYIQTGNVQNKGIELSLGFTKMFGKLNWSVDLNYSMNKNTIVKLLNNPNETLRQGGLNGCEVILKQGGTMGDLYTFTDFKRNNMGEIIVGLEQQVMQEERAEPQFVGSVLPKGNIGLNNKFAWKGLECGVLITARLGGVCASQTQAFLDSYGVSQKTAELRDRGGLTIGGQHVSTERYYTVVGGETPIWNEYVYSATNIRIKELFLSYTLDNLIKGAKVSLGLSARNLLMLYNKAPFDPESAPSTNIYYQGFDYFLQPSQRSIGVSVSIKF